MQTDSIHCLDRGNLAQKHPSSDGEMLDYISDLNKGRVGIFISLTHSYDIEPYDRFRGL